MTELTCAEARQAAAEFALDILEPDERVTILAHLAHCRACQDEVDSMSVVGARLLDLIPGTEPPLGFELRVLARVHDLDEHHAPGRASYSHRHRVRRPGLLHRPRLMAGVAAASAVVTLVSLGWFAGRTSSDHTTHAVLTADFHQGSRDIGEIYTYGGSRPWLTMTVHGVTGAEKVTCLIVWKNGDVTNLGSFGLVSGSGSWSAPDKAGIAGLTGARLVGPTGQVIATANFS